MGCKAEGAAQGYIVLGGIVLLLYGLNMIIGAIQGTIDMNSLIEIVLGITLLLMVVLSFDASGFVNWKVGKSGVLVFIFGLVCIFVVSRGLLLNPLQWLLSLGTLAGFMIVLGGLLLILRK
ncbi:MAG: hypothetical protein P1Q69_20300 [Candidatus Thorarchaeota archaeon]|nr:hypothetical protein [Candidatus Thorarchaeota archaeon]